MKHRIMRSIAAVLALVLSISILGACQNMNTGTSDEKVAAVFEGDKISLTELELYAYMEQFEAEYQSGDYITAYYGDAVTYWTTDMSGVTMEEYAKKYAVARMLQTKVLNKYAASEGITLDAEEQARADKVLENFKDKYAPVVAVSGASDELIAQFVKENAIANKVYKEVIANIDTTMDDAAMLRKRGSGISLYASVYKSRESEDEDLEKYTNEERTENLNRVYDLVAKDIEDGLSYEEIVEKYADEENVSVSNLNEYSVKPDDAVPEGEEISDYKQLLWTLGEGESDTLKLSYNAYFITCVNADDPEYRATAEETEISNRKAAIFAEKMEELSKKYDRFHLYEDVYEEARFKEALYTAE
ncbi:MAG: hypothetical protein IJL78_10675 [Lachnospiraceae bacterium]|nr:hypothetical protein [Lachnospiraceae bacterium]